MQKGILGEEGCILVEKSLFPEMRVNTRLKKIPSLLSLVDSLVSVLCPTTAVAMSAKF